MDQAGFGPGPGAGQIPETAMFTGRVFGEPVAMRFIRSGEYDLIPAEARPPALRESGGGWYAVLSEVSPARQAGSPSG